MTKNDKEILAKNESEIYLSYIQNIDKTDYSCYYF